MFWQWLATYLFLAATLALALGMYLMLKAEMRQRLSRLESSLDSLSESHASLTHQLDSARAALAAFEERVNRPSAADTPGPAERARAVRMSRRGEGAEKIAASLGIPLPEIELMLKVQRLIEKQMLNRTEPKTPAA